MKIRTKVILLIAAFFAVLGAAEYEVDRSILDRSFSDLEREDARTAMRRVKYALDQQLKVLAVSAAGWGNWAEAYQFANDHNPSFITANTTATTLKQLDVSLMLIVDAEGRILMADAYDLSRNRPLDIDLRHLAFLPANFPWLQKIKDGRAASGLLQTNRGVMMLAGAPVLDGNEGGPPRGMVLLGRVLSAAEVQEIGSHAQALVSMSVDAIPAESEQLIETQTTTMVFRSFNDLYDHPIIRLRVDVPREISARGRTAVAYAYVYFIGSAITILVLLIVILHRWILEPLAKITDHAVAIGKDNELTARLAFSRRDEIGSLARAFDQMVEKAERSRSELVQNVNELRAANLEIVSAKESAESANRAKSEFLANMSHEIRTPMNGVFGMTELLLDSSLNHTQRDYALTIQEAGSSLLTVINDILDFSKVEAGKLELEHLDIDLRKIIEDVARLLSIQAQMKGVGLVVKIASDLPSTLNGDAGRVRQVLLNLAGNAIKFTQSGEVSIEVKMLSSDSTETFLRCEVRDTGVGIPADRLSLLFAPFSQVDSSTTRQFGGTGLGLSIAKRLVTLMNGEVGVQSKEGAGSLFWFTARFAAGERIERKQACVDTSINGLRVLRSPPKMIRHVSTHETRAGARPRILVAEDNVVNQKVAGKFLESLQYSVEVVANGQEAVEAWQTGNFDLILMDCQMPVLDGFGATRTIRAQETGRIRIPIVALTANAMKSDEEQCRLAGMDDFISKPIDRIFLQSCLQRFLSSPTCSSVLI